MNIDSIFGKVESKLPKLAGYGGYLGTLTLFQSGMDPLTAIWVEHEQLFTNFAIPTPQRIVQHAQAARPIINLGIMGYLAGEFLDRPKIRQASENLLKGSAMGILVGSCGGGPSSPEDIRLWDIRGQTREISKNMIIGY